MENIAVEIEAEDTMRLVGPGKIPGLFIL